MQAPQCGMPMPLLSAAHSVLAVALRVVSPSLSPLGQETGELLSGQLPGIKEEVHREHRLRMTRAVSAQSLWVCIELLVTAVSLTSKHEWQPAMRLFMENKVKHGNQRFWKREKSN